MNGIDPKILRLVMALVIAGIIIELLDRVSNTAAWSIVFLLILGMFLKNEALIDWLDKGSIELMKGI